MSSNTAYSLLTTTTNFFNYSRLINIIDNEHGFLPNINAFYTKSLSGSIKCYSVPLKSCLIL